MVDAYKVELQEDLIRVKLELESTSFRPDILPMESAMKLEDSKNEVERIDDTAELEDDDMEETHENEEEDEEVDGNSTNSGTRKGKHPPFVLSTKLRLWLLENYTHSSSHNSFILREEIASEYSKAHPESRPLEKATISKIIKMIWGNKVRQARRRRKGPLEGSRRVPGYSNLIRKTISKDEAVKLSESVFCLPVSQLVIQDWTVEMFLNPLGVRYRKGIQQIYVDKHPAILEVYFNMYEPHAELERNSNADEGNDAIEGDNLNSIDSAVNNPNSNSGSSNVNTSNIGPERTLCAHILCNGQVISAEKLDIWDNKSVPTLGKVKSLLEVISNFKICFGCDIPESWATPSFDSECLNPKEKVMVVHKSFDDILSSKGQRKLISTDCKILISFGQRSCENCSRILNVVRKRKARSQKNSNKKSPHQNHCTMTRAELVANLKRKNSEIRSCKMREKYLRMKLSEVNGTESEEATDSESSTDEEEDESES